MWETEATEPADLAAPHRLPGVGGENTRGNLRLQGRGEHKGGTKEENGGHTLGMRPPESICGGRYSVGCWASRCLLNRIKLFPEQGLPNLPRPPVYLSAGCQRRARHAGRQEQGSLYNSARSSPLPLSCLFPEGHSRTPSAGERNPSSKEEPGSAPDLATLYCTPAGVRLLQTGIPCLPARYAAS